MPEVRERAIKRDNATRWMSTSEVVHSRIAGFSLCVGGGSWAMWKYVSRTTPLTCFFCVAKSLRGEK